MSSKRIVSILIVVLIVLQLYHSSTSATCSSGWPIQNRVGTEGGELLMVSPDTPFTCGGFLTQWRYQTTSGLPFKALVLRQQLGGSSTQFTLLGINDIPAGSVDQEVTFDVPESDRIRVEAGDVVGWSYPYYDPTADAPLLYTATAAASPGVDTKIMYLDYTLLPAPERSTTHIVLDVGQVFDFKDGSFYREYSILATANIAPGKCPSDWDHWGNMCCPANWDLWEDKCFHHSTDLLRTYPETKSYCSSVGGKPITVLSEAEMTYVGQRYQPEFWLGCTDGSPSLEGLWTCGEYDARILFYEESTFVGYWNWATSEPNNGASEFENENCVKSDWMDWHCDLQNATALCEVEAVPTVGQVPGNTGCPANYDLLESMCYHYRTDVVVTYDRAKAYCQTTGGRLVVFQTQEKMDYLYTTYSIASSMWLGCMDNNPTEGHWTCDGYDSTGLYFTKGGTSAGFWNWRTSTGEPTGGTEDCVYSDWSTKEWNDAPCMGMVNGLLCEQVVVEPTTSEPTTSEQTTSGPTTPSLSQQPSVTGLLESRSGWYQMATDSADNTPQPGYCLQTPNLETIEARTSRVCGLYCQRHPQCVSFNFIKNQQLCELKSTKKEEAPADFEAVNDCTYFEQL